MATVRLSKRTVDALVPRDKVYVAYDSELRGFGVRVMPSGTKTWIAEFRPGAGGRRVMKRRISLGSTTILTADEARKLAKDTLADARRGDDPAARRSKERATATLAFVIDDYLLKGVAGKKSPGTEALYTHYLNKLVGSELRSRKITLITRADVARLHRAIGKDRPPTANRVLASLSGVFNYAAKNGLAPEGFNPVKGIDKFPEEGRDRYLGSEELARLGAAIREAETIGLAFEVDEANPKSRHARKPANRRTVMSPFAAAAIRLLLFTGCRLREILHLKWEHVDLERGLLFLAKSKTGRKTIILNAPAMELISTLPRAGDFVIAGNDPREPRHDLKKPWEAVIQRAGLNGVRIHDLRHSFASIGAGNGMGLPIIGKLLGHAQPSSTQRYAHLDADPLRQASNRIGATIAGAMGEAPMGIVVPMRRP